MIFGEVPYLTDSIEELIKRTESKNVKFKESVKISEETKNLILGLLEPNPDKRISHENLFNIVFEKKEYFNNLFTLNSNSPIKKITNKIDDLEANPETETKLNIFTKKILFERNKYRYLLLLSKYCDSLKE